MRKLIAVAIVLVPALAFAADQVIQYNEAMVGAGHPTLADTLNRGFLVDHETDGTHSASTVGSSQITDGAIVNADVNASAGIATTKIGGGLVTDTELSYLDNVTSAIQTQFGLKAPLASPTFTGTVTIPTPFTLGAVSVLPTGTELNFVDGVTSAIQTQIDLKAPLASPSFTGTLDVAQGDSGGQLNLLESSATGTEYRGIKVPDSLTDNVVFLLPTAAPTEGQVLVFGAPSGGTSTTTFAIRGAKTILDNVSAPTAEQMYNSINVVNAAITVLLPTAVAGMNGCVQDSGSAHDIIVDVQAGDDMTLVGVEDTNGDGLTNASGSSAGDYICVVAFTAGHWTAMESRGTWAAQ